MVEMQLAIIAEQMTQVAPTKYAPSAIAKEDGVPKPLGRGYPPYSFFGSDVIGGDQVSMS